MTMNQISRTMINRIQTKSRIQRLVHSPGATNSPSEQAIRSISSEFRSTFRW